jgi:Transposase DDE domain
MEIISQRLSFAKSIAQYARCFDVRTYRSFRAVIESLLLLSQCTQAEFALQAGKSLAALQYFFQKAKWSVSQINALRLSVIRHRTDTADRETDMLVLDGTVSPHDKDCESEAVSRVWDNCIKKTVCGYEVFGAAIVTAEGDKYPLTLKIFDPRKWDSVFQGWIKFLRWCLRRTKAMLVVVDKGFRNSFLLAAVLAEGRQFLVRVTITIPVWVKTGKKHEKKRGRQPRFPGREKRPVQKILGHRKATKTDKGMLWIIRDAIVDAWKDEVAQSCAIIILQRTGFREPLVLCSSESGCTLERALELVGCYFRRWKIETLFLELKSWFQLTDYKLSTLCAIERYFHCCLVAHGILHGKERGLADGSPVALFVRFVLRRTRNIKQTTFLSLKCFYEMSISPLVDLASLFTLFLAKNYGITA